MGRCRGVPFEFPNILIRLLRSPRRAGGRTNKMKTTNYLNYNSNQQVLTELLGQLMRGGGGNSSSGYGGGGNRQRGIRRSGFRPRRRPGARPQASTPARKPQANGSAKPAAIQQAGTGGSTTAKAATTAAGQKRNATDSSGGTEKKKVASEQDSKESKASKDDPNLKGLSEDGVRWYMRYIKEGLDPKTACKKAWEHRTEASEFEPQWGREFVVRESPEDLAKIKRLRKRFRKPEPHEDHRIAVHPKDFPDQMLDLESVVALEEAISFEIAKGADVKLQFTNAYLRPGALLVDCANEATVNWLKEVVTNLPNWDEPKLTTSLERVIPDAYVMTVALPKSIGQEFDRTLALITAQNEDLNTEVWKLINEREENERQVVTIRVDKDSFNTIKRNEYKLFYRFDRVSVHFHRYLRFDSKPMLWITNPSCYKQNQVKPPGPA